MQHIKEKVEKKGKFQKFFFFLKKSKREKNCANRDCEAMCESRAVPEMKRDQQSSSVRAGAGSRQLTNSGLTREQVAV